MFKEIRFTMEIDKKCADRRILSGRNFARQACSSCLSIQRFFLRKEILCILPIDKGVHLCRRISIQPLLPSLRY
ncbi:MAG: hypothetical protein C4B57_03685 [Deltaproteobacteria bacterium]|nr:MAG: hypothetical protein C4B57_03685 [Deltaproteobacteria bacterium]RKX60474.1 MAG: hypothetical protein DRP28_01195 [Thermodesulfobacteriota bacterium]